MSRPLVGWREWVGLPGLGIPVIEAKIDTGAASSSIDVSHLQHFVVDGEDRVRFRVHVDRGHTVEAEATVFDVRTIRNPGRGGREEQRYVIRTDLVIGDDRWPVEVNLARRHRMEYRMLIGREALAGRVLVDPNESYLMGERP